jgi:periplasmic divalent cation tolerance protein
MNRSANVSTPECVVVSTTVADDAAASALAESVIAARLAACVQMTPIRSVYRWKGAVHRDPEVLLRFKTIPDNAEKLTSFIRGKHPYELPEILVETAGTSPDYAAWIRAETDR